MGAPLCSNGVLNAEETDVDCGGRQCTSCPNGLFCRVSSDCAANSVCAATSLTCQHKSIARAGRYLDVVATLTSSSAASPALLRRQLRSRFEVIREAVAAAASSPSRNVTAADVFFVSVTVAVAPGSAPTSSAGTRGARTLSASAVQATLRVLGMHSADAANEGAALATPGVGSAVIHSAISDVVTGVDFTTSDGMNDGSPVVEVRDVPSSSGSSMVVIVAVAGCAAVVAGVAFVLLWRRSARSKKRVASPPFSPPQSLPQSLPQSSVHTQVEPPTLPDRSAVM